MRWLGETMNTYKQEINDYKLPDYMLEILSNNYCPNFLNMNMVKENNDYVFNYRTGRYKQLEINRLNTYFKLVLLKSIILLNERNESWLIRAENYLIEPELIYSINNNVDDGNVRILFYPDNNKLEFGEKISLFADKIKNRKDKNEIELLDRFKKIASVGDCNKTKIFLDKNILRLETAWN